MREIQIGHAPGVQIPWAAAVWPWQRSTEFVMEK